MIKNVTWSVKSWSVMRHTGVVTIIIITIVSGSSSYIDRLVREKEYIKLPSTDSEELVSMRCKSKAVQQLDQQLIIFASAAAIRRRRRWRQFARRNQRDQQRHGESQQKRERERERKGSKRAETATLQFFFLEKKRDKLLIYYFRLMLWSSIISMFSQIWRYWNMKVENLEHPFIL